MPTNKFDEIKRRVSESRKSTTSSWDRIIDEVSNARQKNDETTVDEQYMRKFFSDTESYLSRSEYALNNMSWNEAMDSGAKSRRNETVTDLTNRANAINRYLSKNNSNTDIQGKISEYLDAINKTSVAFDERSKYFSNWKSQDEYDTAARQYGYSKKYDGKTSTELQDLIDSLEDGEEKEWLKTYASTVDYDEKAAYDLEAAQKEIEKLEKQKEDLFQKYRGILASNQSATTYLTGQNNKSQASGNYIGKIEGEESDVIRQMKDLEDEINQKKQYLNLADRVQYGIKLSSVADPNSKNYDPEFNNYTGYVADVNYELGGKPYFDDETYAYINNPTVTDNRTGGEISARDLLGWNETAMSKNSPYYNGLKVETILDFMTDDEIAIYNYYYNKHGKDAAKEYIEYLSESLNARKAQKDFEKYYEGNKLLELGHSITAGLDQFGAGIANLGNGDDYIPTTYSQYLSSMVREDLADVDLKWYNFKEGEWDDANIFGSSFGQTLYDVGTTTANMAPSILVNAAVGLLNPVAGAWLGAASMGASAAGNAYADAINRGLDKSQAAAYGVAIGVSEALLEKALGGISKLGGTSTKITKAASGIDNALLRFAANYGGRMASEAFEEGLQEILDPIFQNAIFGTDEDINWEEVAYSALLGGLSAGAFELGGTIKQTKVEQSYKAKYDGSVDELIKEGLESDINSESFQLATQYKEKTDAKKNLTGAEIRNLVEANERQFAVEDFNTAKSTAEKRLTELGESNNIKKIAELAAKRATGQKLTRSEKSTLARSRYGAQVAKEMQREAQPDNGSSKPFDTSYKITYKSLDERIGTEGRFGVSDTGKSIVRDTGKEVDIDTLKFKKITEDGKVKLVDPDGTVVDAGWVDWADDGQSYLVSAVSAIENITPESATDIIRIVDRTKPLGAQMNGIDQAFTYGYNNYSKIDLMAGEYVDSLTNEQMEKAYELGKSARKSNIKNADAPRIKMRTAADATMTEEQKVAKQKARFNSNAEVYFEDGKKIVKFEESGKYSDRRMAAVHYAKFLTKLGIGGKYYFYKSYVDKAGNRVYKNANGEVKAAPNGMFMDSDGSIHIDLNAGEYGQGTTLFTLGHELTHFIKAWSEEKFKVLSDFLIEAYGNTNMSMHERVLAKQKFLQDIRGEEAKVTYNEAFEEVVADAMSTMLTDGDLHLKLAKLRAQDKGLFNKIRQFFNKMIAKFRSEYAQLTPDQQDAQDIRAMKDAFDRIQTAFAEALVEASDNFHAAQNSTEAIENSDGTVYSNRGYQKVFFKENVFPPFNESQSEAHELAERWAKSETTETGERKLISYHNQWYLVESFEDLKYGYQIMKKLTKQEYIKEASYYGTITGYQSLQNTSGENAALLREVHNHTRRRYSVDSDAPQHRGADHSLHGVGTAQNRERNAGSNNRRASESSGLDSQGENRSAVRKSDRDSNGNRLSKAQLEYFKESMVRDENGNLKVVYHGTRNANFTVFKRNVNYFTDSKEMASSYSPNGDMYEGYLDIKKPYYIDAQGEKWSRIPIDDATKNFLQEHGASVFKEAGKWRTTPADIASAIEETVDNGDMDYDGIIIRNIDDTGSYYKGKDSHVATDYIVFNSNQFKNADNKVPTSNPDIRYSERVQDSKVKTNATYAEIQEEQQKLYQRERDIMERKRVAENNHELLQALDDYSELVPEMKSLFAKRHQGTATQTELNRIEEIKTLREERLKRVADLQESLGLNALTKEAEEIRAKKEELRVASDEAWAREGAEKENAAIEKAGVSATEYFRKKALKAFKTTTNFNEAGYLLPDGKLLNFSGGERNHRYRDHREIGEIYEATQGVAALNRFLNDGNIRIMAESPGIDIASGVEPTVEQYAAIRRFINANGVKEGQFFVDFSDAEGHRAGNYSYEDRVNADRVVNDIKYFFENGKVREQSFVAQFHWSERGNAPAFYSQMGKVVEGMKQDKFGASSVIPMLRGRGVKAEEIRWSGIQAFLGGKKSVTKQELLNFINSSMLHVEEEARSQNSARDEFVQAWMRLVNYYVDERDIINWLNDLEMMEGYLDSLVWDENLNRSDADYLLDVARKVGDTDLPAKWEDYKLDGGTNYRELVFKMPGSNYTNMAMQAHWGSDAQGVLAHARMQDFEVHGKKMLFIEEIQSDWHNEGAREGYATKTAESIQLEQQRLFDKVQDNTLSYEERQQAYQDLRDFERDNHLRRTGKEVPDAPFKDNYHEYVLKRLLRMAAEEGYDSIGWTTAEIQSQRWSNDYAEGYRIEYDQDIPKFLKKYGKQWGAEVGKAILPVKTIDLNSELGDEWLLDDAELPEGLQDIRTEQWVDDYEHGNEIWSMDITPAMKKSVLTDGQAMYSERGDGVSNRTLLANAFETLSQNSEEYKLIQQYKGRIRLLNEQEEKLSKLNAEIWETRFGKGKYDAEKLKQLEAKAKNVAEEITRQDRKLLDMEASEPLRKVIEQERRKEAQKTKEHVREIQQNKKLRAEQAEYRHKIRKTVRDLDKLLNRGNKKTNVKEDMKGFVSKALELADFIFTDHVSNDDLIRKGITVRMTPREEALVRETEDILTKIYDDFATLTAEEFTDLDDKRKRNMEKLRDLLTSQRNERLKTPVYNLFNDLVAEYASLKNSKQDAVKAAYDPSVEMILRNYIGESNGETDSDRVTLLKNMRVADMTTKELENLYYAYKIVLTSVRNANKLHIQGKAESIQQVADSITRDFTQRKTPDKTVATVVRNISNKMGWDYEKLYYALDRIGSEAFTELVMNIANSENIVMQDVIEAAMFRDEMVEKYGFNKWDVNKKIDREFLDTTGKKFELTLGQLMSLYAYSRRKGAWDHIEYGGFVFGEKALTNPKPADSYKLTKDQCEAITNTLTKEQKGYVEDMQKFLSETMGEKGNEVSMLLYGIKMFGEKNYFPIHVAGEYMANAQESKAKEAAGFSSMTSAGFTKAQNPNAKAPFVLEGFNEIWADHVNEMSRYHGTVPALEDFRRVMNRSTYSDSTADSISLRALMENSYGKEAVDYFDNLYKEANSGAIRDKLEKKSQKLLSLFRKNSVAYSLSVLIQQPASIVRAYALIDKKYFGIKGFGAITSGVAKAVSDRWTKAHTNAYNEMLKYAPGVTMAKEIGGFDTATGGSIRSYLLDTDKGFFQSMKTENLKGKAGAVMDLVDDNAIANLPNLADKIAWIEIWNACKRETAAKHKDLATSSEEFMKIVGERFTEVIRATQVYDSIFAKSPMLKSKNPAVQYLVSFMNEPNAVANMAESAVRDATRGNWKGGVRKAGTVIYSIIFTNVLKSLIYAMRDDDEEETYIEKYIEAITGGLMDDFNALNYIPLVRDVWSVAQGYDVERADMAIVSDFFSALTDVIKNATKDTSDMTKDELAEFEKKSAEATWQLVGSLASFFGIPVKNVRREIKGVLDHARIASANAGMTTAQSAWDKIQDSVIEWIPFMQNDRTKGDKLYDAIINGDKSYLDRLKGTYSTDNAYQNAVRKALRENDSRIKEAALAEINGNPSERVRIQKLIMADGFDQDDVVAATNSEIADLTPDKEDSGTDKKKGFYTTENFVREFVNGDTTSAKTAKSDIISTAIANGKTKEQAEKDFMSNVSSSAKKAYEDGWLTESKTKKLLVEYAGEDEEGAASKVNYWTLSKLYPKYKDLLNESRTENYYEYVKPAGISMDTYAKFLTKTNGLANKYDKYGNLVQEKIDQVKDVIHSLPLTRRQKNALYLAAGYAESGLDDVPW